MTEPKAVFIDEEREAVVAHFMTHPRVNDEWVKITDTLNNKRGEAQKLQVSQVKNCFAALKIKALRETHYKSAGKINDLSRISQNVMSEYTDIIEYFAFLQSFFSVVMGETEY